MCHKPAKPPRKFFCFALWKNECVIDPRNPREMFFLSTLKNKYVIDPQPPREPTAKCFFEKWLCHRPAKPHSFFKVERKKHFEGVRGFVTQSFFQRNISLGFHGSMTHLFFKMQNKKTFPGGSRVCDTIIFSKKHFAGVSLVYDTLIFQNVKSKKFRGGFAGLP